MPRPAKPWYRKQADAWYTKVDGRPVLLARGKASKAAAEQAFHELKAGLKAPGPAPAAAAVTVLELLVAWTEQQTFRATQGEVSARTLAWYDLLLRGFAEACGSVPAADLKPAEVNAWVKARSEPAEGRRGWGSTSRYHAVSTVLAIFKWGVEEGLIGANPLLKLKRPRRNERREEVLTPDQWPQVLALVRSEGFRDLLIFLHEVGCRLGEACRLEAADVDLDAGACLIREHKTRRRTRKPKVLMLTGEAQGLLARLAAAHPSGPLFRNEDGKPWNKDAVNCQMRRLRERSEGTLGREVTAHALRHLFGTDLMTKGVPLALAAKLMGHSNTSTIDRWYNHTGERRAELKAALSAIRPTPADTAPGEQAAGPAAAPPPPASGPQRSRA